MPTEPAPLVEHEELEQPLNPETLPAGSAGEHEPAIATEPGLDLSVIHATRTWVQYGILGFAVMCIVIGAVEALFGR